MDSGWLLTVVAAMRRLVDEVEGRRAQALAAGVIGIGQANVVAKVVTDLPSALPQDVRAAGEVAPVATRF